MYWYKLAQSVSDQFPMVTLYHGSLARNAEAIQQEGIYSKKVDAAAIVEKGIQLIIDRLGLDNTQVAEFRSSQSIALAIERLEQSGFDKVYLSGDKSYAVSNAAASTEWFEKLYDAARRIKYEDFYERRHEFFMEEQALYDRLKANDTTLRELDYDHRHNLWEQNRQIEQEINTLRSHHEQSIAPEFNQIKEEETSILAELFGNDIIIFTVKMPYAVFKSKAVSSHTKDRTEQFEQMYREYHSPTVHKKNWFDFIFSEQKEEPDIMQGWRPENVWEFFQEVHLSSVEPEYIVAQETMRAPKMERGI